jgi:hypothetical protein
LTPQRYEVVIKGRLSPTLISALDGFEVTRFEGGLTHLVGWVTDQTLLHSRLEVLRDFNVELISLNASPEATDSTDLDDKLVDQEDGSTR